MKSKLLTLLLLPAVWTGIPSARACSVCGCSLSSDWGLQGGGESPGAYFSLRCESFDQTDLRSGPGSVDAHRFTFPNDGEIQLSTTNRNAQLQFDDVLNRKWALSLLLPHHDRGHRTIAEGDTGISTSHASGLGDARVMARYALSSGPASSWNLQFGLKLPTGRTGQNFATGPQAGEPLDRGLQLGTGTPGLLAGLAWFGRPGTDLGVFAQVQLDQPLATRDGFAPSTSLTLNGGLRWLNSTGFTPQLQLNLRQDGREHGINSDRANSGGHVAYVSPGLTVEFSARLSGFVFEQLPVYQRWNGLQLQPRSLLITGMNCRW